MLTEQRVGSKMLLKYLYLILAIILIIFIFWRTDKFYYSNFPETVPVFRSTDRRPEFFNTWSSCARSRLFDGAPLSAAEFWSKFAEISQNCDREAGIRNKMDIRRLTNMDEAKFAIYPKQEGTENTFVTLGIGLDISAEKTFKRDINRLGHNVTFFGADPIFEGNSKIFSEIGTYFPFAVSGTAGYSLASVLVDNIYKPLPVATIDIYYFLSNVLKKTFIEYLWMDTEYAEYQLLDMFFQDGPLDKLGITFCQMSLEVHRVSDETRLNQFREFIKRLLIERRYGIFLPEHVGHNRLWLFNFESDACVRKFLS